MTRLFIENAPIIYNYITYTFKPKKHLPKYSKVKNKNKPIIEWVHRHMPDV